MAYRSIDTAERILTLHAIASYLNGYLGKEGFKYTQPTEDMYQYKLVGPDEAVIYLSLEGDSKGDRLSISGGFHIGKDKFGNTEFVRPNCGISSGITVAVKRGDEAIGHAVLRRFLPKYLAELAQARKQRDESEAYLQAKLSNLQRLQNLGGDTRKLDRDAVRGYLHIGEMYGHIEATNDSATLELHCLTIEQAEAVIKLLRRKS